MELLEERIRRDGKIRGGDVLKVDSFLNHQMDVSLFAEIGKEFRRLFGDCGVTKILTIEASGIGIACVTAQFFGCPVIFAKKNKTKNIAGDVYISQVESFTQSKRPYNIFVSKDFLHAGEKVLTHIDAVPDNFLLTGDDIRLIDWEYAGEQDPHVDIAMFAIYALYDRAQVDTLIDAYFPEGCPGETRLKIYCYVAACGLLWSNWCEYKRQLGVEFGEYSLRQYRYAKEFYRIFRAEEGEKA